MADYGDSYPVERGLSVDKVYIPMATAIARTYTKDGFVVAADGLMVNASTGKTKSESAQKIFPFGHALACCGCGVVRIGSEEREDEIVFDFLKATTSCAQTISMARYQTLRSYMERCAKKLDADLRRALGNVWRQLLFLVNDNYTSLSTTTTLRP